MKLNNLTGLTLGLFVGASNAEIPATNTMNAELANLHNSCIVQLSQNTASDQVQGIAKNLARRANAKLKYIYSHSLKGFTLNMPCHAAQAAFGNDQNIVSMVADGVVFINKGKPNKGGGGGGSEVQTVSYGTQRVAGPLDGSGYTAWVIDTGVDLAHPDLNVDSTRGFTAISRGGMNDQNGHGSHVAGIIGAINNTQGSLGVAPNTTIIPVRVLDRRGSGSISGVIAGVDHVAANAAPGDCVNMSLGGGISSVLDVAVTSAALESGAYFVLAAGNEGDSAMQHSPARANGVNVFTISAIDDNDHMPSWSNYGNPPVEYSAPGVAIFSTWKNGGTNTISGTSMAAPHACAVLMLMGGAPKVNGVAIADPDGNPDPIISLE